MPAKERVAPELPGRQARLRPVAAPVSTFSKPGPDIQPDSGMNLAKSLASISPDLEKLVHASVVSDAADNEVDYEKGRALAIENAGEWRDAVSRDQALAAHSPWVQRGAKEQLGRIVGFDIEAKLNEAYLSWADKDNPDPKAFSEFVGKNLGEIAKNTPEWNDQSFRAGIMPRLQQVQQNLATAHQSYVSKRTIQVHSEQTSVEAGQIVQGAMTRAREAGTEFDAASVAQELRGLQQRSAFLGFNLRDSDKIIRDSVIAEAERQGDPRILDVLYQDRADLKPGSTQRIPGIGKTAEGSEEINKAKTRIWSNLTSMDAYREKMEKRQREEATEKFVQQQLPLLTSDPHKPYDRQVLERAGKIDKDLPQRLLSLQSALRSADDHEDPKAFGAFATEFYSGRMKNPGQELMAAIERRDVRSRIQISRMAEDATKLESEPVKRIINDPTVTHFRSILESPFKGQFGEITNPDGLFKATEHYTRRVLEFAIKNPSASQADIVKAASEAVKDAKIIGSQDGSGDTPPPAEAAPKPVAKPTPAPTTKPAPPKTTPSQVGEVVAPSAPAPQKNPPDLTGIPKSVIGLYQTALASNDSATQASILRDFPKLDPENAKRLQSSQKE